MDNDKRFVTGLDVGTENVRAIIATVDKVENEQEVILEIADGVKCRFVKGTIMNVINNNQPSQTSNNTMPSFGENKKG